MRGGVSDVLKDSGIQKGEGLMRAHLEPRQQKKGKGRLQSQGIPI